MRRLAVILVLLACVGASPAGTGREAPADEYFGRLKMSPLGIRAGIGILARNYQWRTQTDTDLVHDADTIRDAFEAWRAKYPNDSWLAPTAMHLAELYLEIQTDPARTRGKEMLRELISVWPKTREGRRASMRLAQGFKPFHEETALRPTPEPRGGTPKIEASPAPTESPTPEPTPTPTPSPTPTPTPKPKSVHSLFGR